MLRIRFMVSVVTVLLAISSGGCSLVVDFDRSLLLDSGIDGGVDAEPDATVDAGFDEKRDAAVDAPANAG